MVYSSSAKTYSPRRGCRETPRCTAPTLPRHTRAAPPLRVGTKDALQTLRGRDRGQDERLASVSPSKGFEVDLAPLRRDEERRVDHSSHGERGSRGCARVMTSTVSRNSGSTRGSLTR